jgi:hypothetical protein
MMVEIISTIITMSSLLVASDFHGGGVGAEVLGGVEAATRTGTIVTTIRVDMDMAADPE